MTTVAYKDGVLAADGRETGGDEILRDDCVKIERLPDGRYFAITGDSDVRALKKLLKDGALPTVKQMAKVGQSHGVIIACPKRKKLWYLSCNAKGDDEDEQGCFKIPTNRPFARGSGGVYAQGAMLAGASAKEAVKAAIKADVFSGGKVQVVKLWQ